MDLFADLSEKQREAVETINDDLEIIACAGAEGHKRITGRRIT